MDKLDYLIEYLLKEDGRQIIIPSDRIEKQRLYRALVNIREPMPISEEFLQIEDKYLTEELGKKEITNVEDIKTVKEKYQACKLTNNDTISLWQGDITKLKIGAIVNAGNSQGLGCFIPNHNCIDNQINTFAGVRLRLACNEIMKKSDYNIETGKAIITEGYNLPSDYVIQTVGPIIENEVTDDKKQELAKCYISSLKLAVENDIRTIAFPCISTGVFMFPKDLASQIAIKAVDEFVTANRDKIDKIVFTLWEEQDVVIYEQNIR